MAEVVLRGRAEVEAILDGDRRPAARRRRPVQRARRRRRARVRPAAARRGRAPRATTCSSRCACTSRSRARRPAGRASSTTRTSTAPATSTPACAPRASCCSRCCASACRSAASSSTRSRRSTSPTPSRGRAIGARTTESQIHRQLGSGLSMPVGFKNRTDGNVQVAVDAVRAAAATHSFAGVDHSGTPAILHTTGNPDGHVILRGGSRRAQPRRRRASRRALAKLRGGGARRAPRHRRLARQQRQGPRAPAARRRARSASRSPRGSRAIVGVMLESFLVAGRQDVADGHELTYGQSITDACMDWDATVDVLDGLAAAVRDRRALVPTWPRDRREGRARRRRADRRLDRPGRPRAPRRARRRLQPQPGGARAGARARRDRRGGDEHRRDRHAPTSRSPASPSTRCPTSCARCARRCPTRS